MGNVLLFWKILSCLLIVNVLASSKDECIDEGWNYVFNYERYNRHMPILTNFNKIEENNITEISFNFSIYEYNSPGRLLNTFQELLKPYEDNNGKEDIVDWVQVSNEDGKTIFQEMFWDLDAVQEDYTMPSRKDYGPDFKINSKVILEPDNVPEVVRSYAFSKSFGLVDGLFYNLSWEIKAEELRKKASEMKKFYLYEEAKSNKKHMPKISFKEKGKVEYLLTHSVKTKEDKDHFISTIYVEDEFGRVVYMKDLTKEDNYDSISEEISYFETYKEYRTLTPYEFCSKHGLYQGETFLIPNC